MVFCRMKRKLPETSLLLNKAYMEFLRQKANVSWIKEGDSNSALFHAVIRGRQKQNSILSIVNAEGIRLIEPLEITTAFINFYTHHLGDKLKERLKVKKECYEDGPKVTRAS